MDALQLLTLTLSGRCAFSVLTLVVPHLPPPGSFAILLMADTGSPSLPLLCIIDASENVDSLLFPFFVITH